MSGVSLPPKPVRHIFFPNRVVWGGVGVGGGGEGITTGVLIYSIGLCAVYPYD